jgi:hypothetical protein
MTEVMQWLDEMLWKVNQFAKDYTKMLQLKVNLWINKSEVLVFNK